MGVEYASSQLKASRRTWLLKESQLHLPPYQQIPSYFVPMAMPDHPHSVPSLLSWDCLVVYVVALTTHGYRPMYRHRPQRYLQGDRSLSWLHEEWILHGNRRHFRDLSLPGILKEVHIPLLGAQNHFRIPGHERQKT